MVLQSRDIKAFLTGLAVLAASRLAVPGNTVHAGVTVLRSKRPEAFAASDASARALDELQNGFGDGPCLTALRTRTTVLVPDLPAEHRWQPYTRAAAANGVLSILAVPLDLADDGQAVLNLYSSLTNGFPGQDIATAEAFAEQAASSVRLALRITQLTETRHDLAAAVQSRAVIDMALGVLMAEHRCSRDTAFGILSTTSITRNIKLRDAAAAVVLSASGEERPSTPPHGE
jgi:GAF domain-containing protein